MITGDIVVLRPSAPGVAPGTALPAGPVGPAGPPGANGSNGVNGAVGAPGVIQSINGKSAATITLAASDIGALPVGQNGSITPSSISTTGTGSFGSFTGAAVLDGRAFADAANTSGYFADYPTLANVRDTFTNTEAISPLTGPGALRDHRLVQMRDFDTTNYAASNYRVISNALRVVNSGANVGGNYQQMWKDQHGVWSVAIGNTGGVVRGVSGLLGEAIQLGTGVATNEFSASSINGAPGQPALLAPVLGIAYNYYGNADGSHNVYGVCASMYGYAATAAFRAASVAALGQTGSASFGLKLDDLIVSQAAITMPQSASGASGTIISYGSNSYSFLDRAGGVFAWVVGGTTVLSVGTGAVRLNLGSLGNFANDAAAASAGVSIGQLYRNGSVLMIRAQ